jgi:hypothetical protein
VIVHHWIVQVELVDIMPTLIELAGLPAFDHENKGEPALQGRSLAPLVLRTGSSGLAVQRSDGGFNASYSQYGRSRCPTDLFVSRCPDSEDLPGKYIGYSVRTATHRYTRWVVVAIDGTPSWMDVVSEELYEEVRHIFLSTDQYGEDSERAAAGLDPGLILLRRWATKAWTMTTTALS